MPESVDGLTVDLDRRLVYVGGTGCNNNSSCDVPGAVYVIDERTNTIRATIITSAAPPAGNHNVVTEQVALDPISGSGYASNFFGGTVAVFDLRTNKVTDTITIPGGKNFGVAIDPIRRKVYVSDVLQGHVNVIQAGDRRGDDDHRGDDR
jgi:DNA-binding beta-propeller fold protein YncE